MIKKRLVVGISGSSGVIFGVRLLQALQGSQIETHLVVTPSARLTLEQETDYRLTDVLAMASAHYNPRDIGAAIASGSFQTIGMVVIPCSIKSLSAIANGYTDDLLARAADVTLKEGRPLILAVRETPLHRGHLRLLDLAARSGAVIYPPMPSFYNHPATLEDMINEFLGRVLQRLGIDNDLYHAWTGLKDASDLESPASVHPDDDLWQLSSISLATVGADGQPHAASVYFAADPARETLYFLSGVDTQHSLDVQTQPMAAATLSLPEPDWRKIRGLQLRGTVTPVLPGAEWDRAWQLYTEKFSFVRELKAIVEKNGFYAFRPRWFRRIDNRQSFGYKEEWTLGHE